MKPEEKASLPMVFVFLVLLLSLVWTGNGGYGTKLKVSLVLAVPILVAVGIILALQRWWRNTLLAYSLGLLILAVGYVASGYILLGKTNVLSAVVGILIGVAFILKRWEKTPSSGDAS